MAISFLTIPLSVNAPLFAAEFDASGATAGLVAGPHDTLLIGQMLLGSGLPGTIYSVDSADDGNALFGRDSQLGQMIAAFFAAYPGGSLFAIGLADATAGVAAKGSVIFSGTATESRELVIYVGGRRVAIPVRKGDTADAVETAALAAFTQANLDGFVASEAGNTGTGVDFSANHKGSIGNQIFLGHSLNAGERVPGGLTVTVNQMSGGLTDPSYSPAVTAMADTQYATIAAGIANAAALSPIIGILTQRWGGLSTKDGQLFAAAADTRANLTTLGNGYNTEQLTLLGVEQSAKMRTPWEMAAALAGLQAAQTVSDPALHMRGVKFPAGFSGPARGTEFTYSQRDTLLSDGISTGYVTSDGNYAVDRLVTTYQTNSLGFIDRAFQDLTTKRTLSFLRASMLARVSSKFGRMKLRDDGVAIPAGAPIVSPSIIRQELIALFGEWSDAALVEDVDQFKRELVVARNGSDPNRVDAVLSPNIVNSLLTFAGKISFKR